MNPRVQFHKIASDSPLTHFLSSLKLSPQHINELFDFGAIYCNGLRQRQDSTVKIGDTIRVHLEPKRFLQSGAEWIPEVLFQDEDLLVINKPGGLPTHPTLDNFNENAKVLAERYFKCPIFVTHRLDIPTSGALLFAKNIAAQKGINKLFAKRRMVKIYHATVEKQVEEGAYVHYLNPESKTPKEISATAREGWLECRMQVRHLDSSGMNLEIILETGRTHQIRAQLSFLGCPIVGDVTYGAQSPWGPQDSRFVSGRIALECFRLSFTFRSKTHNISTQQAPDPATRVAQFIVKKLGQKFGVQWLGGPREGQTQVPNTYSDLLRQLSEWQVPLSRKANEKISACGTLRDVAETFYLRSVREDSQQALVQWMHQRYPIVLIHHIPSPSEMLAIQCEGLRYVTLLEGAEDEQRQLGRHHGSLAFLLHDLEHADKFFSDPQSYGGQRNFFRCLKSSIGQGHFEKFCEEDLFCKDFHYVMSDMNSHPLHLFKYLKAIVLMRYLRYANLGGHENLPHELQVELDDFWRRLLHDWGMSDLQIESGVRINRPQWETAADVEAIGRFFYAQ